LLGFNNGVYDTRDKTFRDGKPSDYITKSVGYDFPIDDKGYKKDISKFLSQVFPDEETRKYVLKLQAQALCGHKIKDLVCTHTGRGGNGKSILIKLLSHVFGDYFIEIPSSMITSQNKGTHNQPDPFMSEIQGCRYAVCNEPKNGLKLNDSIVKLFGSQEPVKYRMLYSNDPVILNTQIKLNIYCNNKLEFDASDGGLSRRLKVVKYISKFDEKPNEKNNIYKIDYGLNKTVESWKEDYMKILISLYDPNFTYEEPSSIINWSSEYCDNNNDIKKFVKENFIMTNSQTDYLLLKDLKLLYQQNKEYEQSKLKNLKEYLEKEFNSDFKEKAKVKINNKWVDIRSVIFGWKRIEECEEDDEEEIKI
jgi:P4 family phage/plasmid primase-like protien